MKAHAQKVIFRLLHTINFGLPVYEKLSFQRVILEN